MTKKQILIAYQRANPAATVIELAVSCGCAVTYVYQLVEYGTLKKPVRKIIKKNIGTIAVYLRGGKQNATNPVLTVPVLALRSAGLDRTPIVRYETFHRRIVIYAEGVKL